MKTIALITQERTERNNMNTTGFIRNQVYGLWLIIMALTVMPSVVQAQDCSDRLTEAREMYEQGLYERSVQMLKNIMEACNMSEQQTMEAQKMLAGAHYERDEIEEGDHYIKKFLKTYPRYSSGPDKDPRAFQKGLERFTVERQFSMAIQGGMNQAFPDVQELYPLWDSVAYEQQYSTPQYNENPEMLLNAGISLKWHFGGHFTLSAGSEYMKMQYSRQALQNNQTMVEFKEKISAMNAPLMFEFVIPGLEKLKPGIFLGGYYRYLLTSTANLKLSSAVNNSNNTPPVDIDMLSSRREHNFGGLMGVRLAYRMGFITPFAEARYAIDLQSYVKDNKRHENSGLSNDYNYFSDDFYLNSLQASVGFAFILSRKVSFRYDKWYLR